MNKANNLLQDDQGNYSMARFAVLCCIILGMFNGAFIPFSDPEVSQVCMNASVSYMGIATAAKAITKITEKVKNG